MLNINDESIKIKQRWILFPSLFFIIIIFNVKLRLYGGFDLFIDMV